MVNGNLQYAGNLGNRLMYRLNVLEGLGSCNATVQSDLLMFCIS